MVASFRTPDSETIVAEELHHMDQLLSTETSGSR